jgi:hypothetical protein
MRSRKYKIMSSLHAENSVPYVNFIYRQVDTKKITGTFLCKNSIYLIYKAPVNMYPCCPTFMKINSKSVVFWVDETRSVVGGYQHLGDCAASIIRNPRILSWLPRKPQSPSKLISKFKYIFRIHGLMKIRSGKRSVNTYRRKWMLTYFTKWAWKNINEKAEKYLLIAEKVF